MNDEVNTPKETVNNGTLTVEIPPASPSPAEIELQKANARIAALEAEKAQQAEALAQARIDTASAQAKRIPTKLNNVATDIQLDKAIKQCGGLALWSQLTPQQKAAALGVEGSEQIKDSEIRKYFGKGSEAAAAQSLAKQSPERYRQLRALAKTRGIY